jgi:restriction system protein
MQKPPEFLETVVLDVLLAMGYGGSREDAAQRLGRTGDEGLDGVIYEDRLGLDIGRRVHAAVRRAAG